MTERASNESNKRQCSNGDQSVEDELPSWRTRKKPTIAPLDLTFHHSCRTTSLARASSDEFSVNHRPTAQHLPASPMPGSRKRRKHRCCGRCRNFCRRSSSFRGFSANPADAAITPLHPWHFIAKLLSIWLRAYERPDNRSEFHADIDNETIIFSPKILTSPSAMFVE